jgi:hypothetical protein
MEAERAVFDRYQQSAISGQRSAISGQPSAISYQRSAISQGDAC